MSGPRQPANRVCLPSQRTSSPSFHAMASISTKSQLDVCGAPTSTPACAGAGWLRRVQRLSRQ